MGTLKGKFPTHHIIGLKLTPEIHRHTIRHHTTRHHSTRHHTQRQHTTHKPKTPTHAKLVKNIFHHPSPPQHKTPPKPHPTNLAVHGQGQHKMEISAPKKETPQEIVNRILNKAKDEDKLDSFFANAVQEENPGKHSDIGKKEEKMTEDKLEEFFKHA